MFFQQTEDIQADRFGGDFSRIGQAFTYLRGQFESVFKLETGIEKATG